MEDSAFESLNNYLDHHNQWVGQNIKFSVHEFPELEVVEASLL